MMHDTVLITGLSAASGFWLAPSTPTFKWNSRAVATTSPARATMIIGEDLAKQAWLAKLDAPTWGKAAATLEAVASSAFDYATAVADCEAKVEEPCDQLTNEAAAKAAWLAKLDAPAWGNAAIALAQIAAVTEVQEASAGKMTEDQAKAAWLAKLDAPSWGTASSMSEEAAKRKWLSRLDAPSWGQAATAINTVVAEATQMAALTADCDAGVEVACEELSKEDEAKRAWLAKLDVPSWGAAASAVSSVASYMQGSAVQGSVVPTAPKSEAEAKAAWLAKIDAMRA